MKCTRLYIISLSMVVLSSCGKPAKDSNASDHNVDRQTRDIAYEVLNLNPSDILSDPSEYLGKKIELEGDLNTHSEGAWLTDTDSGGIIGMDVSSEVFLANLEILWFTYQEPFPVKVRGILFEKKIRIGITSDEPEMTIKELYLKVESCEKL